LLTDTFYLALPARLWLRGYTTHVRYVLYLQFILALEDGQCGICNHRQPFQDSLVVKQTFHIIAYIPYSHYGMCCLFCWSHSHRGGHWM